MSREDIAEIYDHLCHLSYEKAQQELAGLPSPVNYERAGEHLAKGNNFSFTAAEIREVDAMRPMRLRLGVSCEGANYIRAEENLW